MLNRIINFYRKRFWSAIKYGRSIGVTIGEDCVFGKISYGSEPYLITIGNKVQITDDVKFFNHGGAWVFRKKYPNFDFFGKITIGDNVYIGNNVLIMPGVTIGSNVIIGAGSVVTKSIQDDSVVVGNPARIISTLDQLEEKLLKYNLNTKNFDTQSKRKVLLNIENELLIKK